MNKKDFLKMMECQFRKDRRLLHAKHILETDVLRLKVQYEEQLIRITGLALDAGKITVTEAVTLRNLSKDKIDEYIEEYKSIEQSHHIERLKLRNAQMISRLSALPCRM